MEIVTLKVFDNAIDAHLLKTRLESEGINCYLLDENMVTLNPLYNISVGGIKLRIHKDDLEDAAAIVREIEDSPNKDESENPVHCPNCNSTNLYTGFKSVKGTKGFLSAIVSFLFMVLPLYYKTVYRCKECETEFKTQEE
jgi:DNA-directed RNA polymerase subunit RPC12/RpoP